MEEVKDINGNVLSIGDEVYYARKQNHSANGEMIKVTITGFKEKTRAWEEGFNVRMGAFTATESHKQLLKV